MKKFTMKDENFICENCNKEVNKLNYISRDVDDFEIIIEKETCKDGKQCDKKIIKIVSEIVGEKLVS